MHLVEALESPEGVFLKWELEEEFKGIKASMRTVLSQSAKLATVVVHIRNRITSSHRVSNNAKQPMDSQ